MPGTARAHTHGLLAARVQKELEAAQARLEGGGAGGADVGSELEQELAMQVVPCLHYPWMSPWFGLVCCDAAGGVAATCATPMALC